LTERTVLYGLATFFGPTNCAQHAVTYTAINVDNTRFSNIAPSKSSRHAYFSILRDKIVECAVLSVKKMAGEWSLTPTQTIYKTRLGIRDITLNIARQWTFYHHQPHDS